MLNTKYKIVILNTLHLACKAFGLQAFGLQAFGLQALGLQVVGSAGV